MGRVTNSIVFSTGGGSGIIGQNIDNTTVYIQNNTYTPADYKIGIQQDQTVTYIYTTNGTTFQDGILQRTPIEIRVYL